MRTGAARAVEAHALPAGGGDDAHARRLSAARDHDREVASPSRERPASGRPSDRRRRPCGQRRRGRRRAPPAAAGCSRTAAGRAVELRELRVVAEAAAGLVDPAQLLLHDRKCRRQRRLASATVTAAVVPSAGKEAVAQFTLRAPGDRDRVAVVAWARSSWSRPASCAVVVAAASSSRRSVVAASFRGRRSARGDGSGGGCTAACVPWRPPPGRRRRRSRSRRARRRRRSGAGRGGRSRRVAGSRVRCCPYGHSSSRT